MTFARPPARSVIQKPRKCHNDGLPFNMALKALFSCRRQRGSSLIVITYSTLQSIAGKRLALPSFSTCSSAVALQPRSAQLQLSALLLPSLLLSAPRLPAKFITSGPQERPDFNSDALCSIALHGRTCRNGAS